jgi:hypothetical protein
MGVARSVRGLHGLAELVMLLLRLTCFLMGIVYDIIKDLVATNVLQLYSRLLLLLKRGGSS